VNPEIQLVFVVEVNGVRPWAFLLETLEHCWVEEGTGRYGHTHPAGPGRKGRSPLAEILGWLGVPLANGLAVSWGGREACSSKSNPAR